MSMGWRNRGQTQCAWFQLRRPRGRSVNKYFVKPFTKRCPKLLPKEEPGYSVWRVANYGRKWSPIAASGVNGAFVGK